MDTNRLKVTTALLAGIGLYSSQLIASEFSVNSTADSVDANPGDGICETTTANECTLRAAAQESNALPGADTIVLSPGIYILTITGRGEDAASTGDIDITDDVSILGIDATNTIINANNIDRVFDVFDPANTEIEKISVQNGDLGAGGNGGGIRNSGSLIMNEVIVKDNNAGTNFGNAGGIFNSGILNLVNVTIDNNSAFRTGGLANIGIAYEGNANATLSNVTISNNSALDGAAGMYTGASLDILGQRDNASLTNVTISGNVGGGFTSSGGGFGNEDDADLTNVTITNNSGFTGGGIFAPFAGPGSPFLQVKNTLIANNLNSDCGATLNQLVSLGNNLSSDDTCNLTELSDLINTDPLVGPLQDNGGLTLTHALLAGSPAIDAGSIDCPPPHTDQRGEPRPVDGNSDGFSACDIGAYEVQPTATIIVSIEILPKMEVNSINLNNKGSIQVAILSISEFLAYNEVNPDSVEFGPAGASPTRHKVKDVNRDGLLDMVFYFKLKETGIECGDTEATLIGETYNGDAFVGTDSIVTKGCGQ